jgi:hypothetical protein
LNVWKGVRAYGDERAREAYEWIDPTYGERWKVFDGFPPHPVYMFDEVDGWIAEEDGPSLVAAAKELARLAAELEKEKP